MDALRVAGASVRSIHTVGKGVPDLICGYAGMTFLFECKVGKAELTADEFQFFQEWKGHCMIVRSVEDALRVIGRL